MHSPHSLINIKREPKRHCLRLVAAQLEPIRDLQQSAFAPWITLAETLHSASELLAATWEVSNNNGSIEGFPRKLKLIQRRAYGFKNFNNYHLRVIAQCG